MNAPPIRREDLISRKAAAATLGIHTNTLDRAAAAAGLTRYRVLGDRQVFFHRGDLDRIVMIEEVD